MADKKKTTTVTMDVRLNVVVELKCSWNREWDNAEIHNVSIKYNQSATAGDVEEALSAEDRLKELDEAVLKALAAKDEED